MPTYNYTRISTHEWEFLLSVGKTYSKVTNCSNKNTCRIFCSSYKIPVLKTFTFGADHKQEDCNYDMSL